MKKTISFLSVVIFCLFFKAQAQKTTDIKKEIQKGINDRFPITRNFDLQFQQYLPSDFDSELYDKEFQEGNIKSYSRLKFVANIPVFKRPKWSVTNTLLYKYDVIDLQEVKDKNDPGRPLFDNKEEFHYLSGSFSFTYYSKLFNKPFVYTGTILVDGSEKDAERVKGLAGATFVLKKTEWTKIGLGVIVFIDPASTIPAAPVFSIEQKFKKSPWIMDFILPQRLLFKRGLLENGRISLGSEVAGDGFYLYSSTLGTASVYDFRQIELRNGLTYEYGLGDLIFTFKGGVSTFLQNKFAAKGEPLKDSIFEMNRNATGYFSLGVSYNPFK